MMELPASPLADPNFTGPGRFHGLCLDLHETALVVVLQDLDCTGHGFSSLSVVRGDRLVLRVLLRADLGGLGLGRIDLCNLGLEGLDLLGLLRDGGLTLLNAGGVLFERSLLLLLG